MSKQFYYFVAECTSTRRGCTQDLQELIRVYADSFHAADKWINANYTGWVHFHVTDPARYLFTSTDLYVISAWSCSTYIAAQATVGIS